MTQGTVTISLADIDKLRQEVKDANAGKEAAEKELVSVKADKRIMKITTNKIESGAYKVEIDSNYVMNYFLSGNSSHRSQRDFDPMYNRHKSIEYLGDGTYGMSTDTPVEAAIRKGVRVVPKSTAGKDQVDFINMEDVQQEIRKKLEEEYNNELGILRNKVARTEQTLAEYREESTQKSIAIQKQAQVEQARLQDIILERTAKFEKELAEAEERYKVLESGKKEQSRIEQLEERLAETIKELNAERSKPWYKKF